MASAQDPAYVLAYRRFDASEDQRLNRQHDAITHGILEGRLVHPSIPEPQVGWNIADLGCGTGSWLNDLAGHLTDSLSHSSVDTPGIMVGFDINDHAFSQNAGVGIQFIKHDCTLPVDICWHGKFDLVNARGLGFALPASAFAQLVTNAAQLLRPGGFFQWLETDSRLFRSYPRSAQIDSSLEVLERERVIRGLSLDLPQTMLQSVLEYNQNNVSQGSTSRFSITNYNLLPGGFARSGGDLATNNQFSDIVMESVQLVLRASLERNSAGRSMTSSEDLESNPQQNEIMALIESIGASMRTRGTCMGGYYPQLIAQKAIIPFE